MRDSSASTEYALDAAVRRLEVALNGLEAAVRRLRHGDGAAQHGAMAAELDASRGRVRALEEVAAEASAALGRAADEVRAALQAEI